MIKVLHVMTRIPVGGVENQLLHVVRSYDKTRFTPVVVSLSEKGEIGREIEASGAEVIALKGLGHQFSFQLLKDLTSIIGSVKPHVLRTHQYHANFYGRLAVRRASVPCVVCSVHNIYTRDRKLHRRLFNRYLARYTDKIIAVSEAVREDILKYDRINPEKIIVITNGVDTERFASSDGTAIRAEFGIPQDAFVVGTVGRLTEQKDQKNLIEAVSRLKLERDIRILISGDGPLMDELKSLSNRLGLGEKTIFAGMRRDIPALLAAMDVFALPSRWEGMPNALLEAMSMGKAIVATPVGGVPDILTNEDTGLLVPVGNVDTLTAAIGRLINDADLGARLGLKARALIEESYSIHARTRQWEELYTSILEKKGALP